MQKIYCYVDESGQDTKSDFFVVVVVVSDENQELLRKKLCDVEFLTKIGKRKWHKASFERKMHYLKAVMDKEICNGKIYFGYYKKPIPYFLPILETTERAIFSQIEENYRLIIYVDGIDRKKAAELTNALRIKGIKLKLVKSRRDESEPLIRLADRWAGCIRASFLNKQKESRFLKKARSKNYIKEVFSK